MEQAGGVGLNLPETSKVFKLTFNFNPAVDAQAIARAIRVGNCGTKKIITFSYDLFMEAHYQAIQDKKQKWTNFFWNEGTGEIKKQFEL